MLLRAKILVVIASLMGIMYVIVAAALYPELAAMGVRKSRERGEAAAQMLTSLLELTPREKRRDYLRERSAFVPPDDQPLWAICDGEDRVVAWSRHAAPPERLNEATLAVATIRRNISPEADGKGTWTLFLVPPPPDLAVERGLWTLFISMLAGTVMLGLAVYGLTLRLVVNPVERLAAASRAAGARGILPKVPQSDRGDEIGALIRSYNSMVDEVNDLRLNLERRVQDAIHELEAAQKKLILSERLSISGRLAAGVAHEINNPLGGMLNAARSLQKKAAPGSRDAEYLDLIVEGLGRVQGIVASMLRFARPIQERGRVDLNEVLDGALLFSKHRMNTLHVELLREPHAPGTPALEVTGNRAELGQVFLNLVVNALDAMEHKEGPRKFMIAAARDASCVTVRVTDTGAGMSTDTLKHAGEFFYSTKTEGRGTGLGLAIVNHILSEHGGTLDFESDLGKGTTATVRLPAYDASQEEPAAQAGRGG